jgi:hypothetical protein
MLRRLGYLFDRHTRQYLAKALVLPVINMYDFIYAAATSSALHRLDVRYNDLKRVILGIRRSVHFCIADLHKLTGLDKLSDRRRKSLLKFMQDVTEEKLYSRLCLSCHKTVCTYQTRFHGYMIPRFKTNVGRQRIAVRGLKLLNENVGS